jgi:hypothetical protein
MRLQHRAITKAVPGFLARLAPVKAGRRYIRGKSRPAAAGRCQTVPDGSQKKILMPMCAGAKRKASWRCFAARAVPAAHPAEGGEWTACRSSLYGRAARHCGQIRPETIRGRKSRSPAGHAESPGHQDHGGVAVTVATVLGGLDQPFDFGHSQIFPRPKVGIGLTARCN